ncbi:hypothetical protein QQ045_001840 [Rhodiola kirilowii]
MENKQLSRKEDKQNQIVNRLIKSIIYQGFGSIRCWIANCGVAMKAWRTVGIWFLVLIGNAVCEDSAVVRASVSAVCPVRSSVRLILGAGEKWCDLNGSEFDDFVVVIKDGCYKRMVSEAVPAVGMEKACFKS